MSSSLSPELFWLAATAALTALLWVPYIINRMVEHRFWPAVYNPQPDTRPQAQWAERLMRAHSNAVENLVVFAPLVLVVHMIGANNTITEAAALIYFLARLAHPVIYTAAIPLARTVVFLVGFFVQVIFALRVFSMV